MPIFYIRSCHEINNFSGIAHLYITTTKGGGFQGYIKSQNPYLQVIAQTAYAMSTDRQRSEVSGCDNYISKPINKALLLEMMANYLNLS